MHHSEKIQIESRHLLLLHQMSREHTEVPAFLFGSRVQGRVRTNSDLDVCLRGKQVLSLSLLSDLSEAADDSLIPYVVDLSGFCALARGVSEGSSRTGCRARTATLAAKSGQVQVECVSRSSALGDAGRHLVVTKRMTRPPEISATLKTSLKKP